MVKKKLVSIIIRGKNEARWLKILLKELKKQTIQNYEIIFCDNNSEDNTVDILKKYKIKKILKFKKYKPGKVLNEAIKKSNGKNISILSAHCVPVNKYWLEEHLNEINKSKDIAAVYGKQFPMPGSSIQNLIDLDIIFKDQAIIYKKDPYLNNANSIFNTKLLKNNLFDSKLTNIEDRIWANKITKKKYVVVYSAKSPVFHLHGVHQHSNSSGRAQTTYGIIKKKYNLVWKKCEFLKPDYFNFTMIINARRIKDKKSLKFKLLQIEKKLEIFKIEFKKIFVISNFKLSQISKNFKFIKPSKSLKIDLKNIYKNHKKMWTFINFNFYINIQANINFKILNDLNNQIVYNNYESITLAEKVKENFIIKRNGFDEFKSTSLEPSENKPSITLLKWSKGCIVDPDYLRRGILFTDNSYIKLI
jgi:glycosyltransferase involved in cell wall biosynthesis